MTTIVPRYETGRVRRPGDRGETATPTWRDRGACLNRPQEWWDDEASLAQRTKARAACLECPVLAQCLTAAQATEKGRWVEPAGMKAGLTVEQRGWLQRAAKRGPYDAEEARLLALEATVSGRKVEDIAEREAVGGLTLSLAVRLVGPVPPLAQNPKRRPYRSTRLSPLERAAARVEDIVRWRQEGKALAVIAKELHVGKEAVKAALEVYLAQHPEVSVPDRRRSPIGDRMEKIQQLREEGLGWQEIDVRLGLRDGMAYRTTVRWRNAAEERGEPIPDCLAREVQLLSAAQVVRMRERAEAGVPDVVQAEEYQISRTQVSKIVTGDQYKTAGGPLRAKRVTSQTRTAGSSRAADYGMAS